MIFPQSTKVTTGSRLRGPEERRTVVDGSSVSNMAQVGIPPFEWQINGRCGKIRNINIYRLYRCIMCVSNKYGYPSVIIHDRLENPPFRSMWNH